MSLRYQPAASFQFCLHSLPFNHHLPPNRQKDALDAVDDNGFGRSWPPAVANVTATSNNDNGYVFLVQYDIATPIRVLEQFQATYNLTLWSISNGACIFRRHTLHRIRSRVGMVFLAHAHGWRWLLTSSSNTWSSRHLKIRLLLIYDGC